VWRDLVEWIARFVGGILGSEGGTYHEIMGVGFLASVDDVFLLNVILFNEVGYSVAHFRSTTLAPGSLMQYGYGTL
jgi:hypothetical protein